jgi:GR25 family glycosyltransferase involved in LPS biosynthesis
MKKNVILTLFLIFIIFISLYYKSNIETFTIPPIGIHDAWYINLDRSKKRREFIEKEASKLGIPVNRWAAIDGSKLTDDDYTKYNIPFWSRPSFALESKQKLRKGEIGCYLSHKLLIEHLGTLNTEGHLGHLILEDDIKIDDDMITAWNTAITNVDPNWDMIFIGLGDNKINDIKNGIGKPAWITGTYAYVIKHSSIKKIYESIKVILIINMYEFK